MSCKQSLLLFLSSAMMKRVLCTALFLFLSSAAGHAACTGSGTIWSCQAGASSSDVQAAINSASDGAVITFAAGAYTWSGTNGITFSPSVGATLICASVGACTVNFTGGTALFGMATYSGTNTHLYRISGFVINQISTGGQIIWWGYNCYPNCSGTFTQIRIDHNTFNLTEGTFAAMFGAQSGSIGLDGNTYGVIDHNTVLSPKSIGILYMLGKLQASPPASPLGTGNNMFVEDNTIIVTTTSPGAGQGCTDVWGGNGIVFRHNTVTNCLVAAHGVTHQGGPQNYELYNNTLIANANSAFTDGYRLFHHQGSGEFISFNNIFTSYSGKSGSAMSMLHYRDYVHGSDPGNTQCDGTQAIDGNRAPTATYRGYPCWYQPGRDFVGNYKPMYVWNNYWSDTLAQVPLGAEDLGGSPNYKVQHIQADRDWYDAVSASAQTSATSPFNGTTGMGFGTLANRPTTCTTSSESAFGKGAAGVGYFATDQGAQGTLYTCSATNTWTVFYTPYTYPHPLVSGEAPPPGPKPPTPPTKLAAVVQ